MYEFVEQFRSVVIQAGITPPDNIVTDGKIHRFSTNGKKGDQAGWYVLHSDGIPGGSFGDWRVGVSQDWCADIGRPLSYEEEITYAKRINEIKQSRKSDEEQRIKETQAKAEAIWNKAVPANSNHEYLLSKKVAAYGLKEFKRSLVAPLRDEKGTIHSLQFIGCDGQKRFLAGGKISGCYFGIGSPKNAKAICIAEGYATSATIHTATGFPVAVAFSKSNLLIVAQIMRQKLPSLTVVVCADDDHEKEGNPGLAKAKEVAKAVGGILAVPLFDNDRPCDKTDFNDMAELYGNERVRSTILAAISTYKNNPGETNPSDGWGDPLPLSKSLLPESYPVEALPDCIKNAVIEVQGFTKAPVPLVASCALAALSLAGQSFVNIKRDDKLTGPVSLFFLTIADSGERKSTCDGFFMQAVREYESEQAELAKPKFVEYNVNHAVWKTKSDGIKAKIRKLAGDLESENDIFNLEKLLLELDRQKPIPPKVPRLIYSDVTPESLKKNLAINWPSAGIISSEGGVVFGAHGMNKDSAMRNLATYNYGWDGKGIPTDRTTTESFNVEEVRLTMAIQVQQETLKEFTSRLGELARGIGFFARVLIAWPESTQGTRFYTNPPESWPYLAAFNRQISNILNFPSPVSSNGKLESQMMSLARLAKLAWVKFHDTIESELLQDGEFYDVKDVASKAADNAVRLACLFHLIDHGLCGDVDEETFDRASLIVLWHLKEAQRVFGEIALSPELINAMELENFCVRYCHKQNVNRLQVSSVLQYGPSRLRKKSAIDSAVSILEDLDRVRLKKEGKAKYIEINPVLLCSESKR